MLAAVAAGPTLAAVAGCSLIYDPDDLPPPPVPPHYLPATKITDNLDVEENPTLVGDGSYVYFNAVGENGDDEDVWRLDRTDGVWSERRTVEPFSEATDDDRAPRLDAAGDRLYLVRAGATGLEVFASSRASLHVWDEPAAVTRVDAVGDERSAAPCDGDRTIFVIHASLTVSTLEEVRGTTRIPVDVGGLTNLRTVSASPDCKRLLVSALGGAPNLDIFELTRADLDAPWDPPERIEALSTISDESSPSSTADRGIIVFERDGDLWQSLLEPPPSSINARRGSAPAAAAVPAEDVDGGG